MKNRIKNLKLRLKLFFTFLRWCCIYPNDIKENWDDMNIRFYNETDEEMIKIFKELEEHINNKEDEGNILG